MTPRTLQFDGGCHELAALGCAMECSELSERVDEGFNAHSLAIAHLPYVGESPARVVTPFGACVEGTDHDHRVAAVNPLVGLELNLLPGLRYHRQDLIDNRFETTMRPAVEEPLELGLDPFDLGV